MEIYFLYCVFGLREFALRLKHILKLQPGIPQESPGCFRPCLGALLGPSAFWWLRSRETFLVLAFPMAFRTALQGREGDNSRGNASDERLEAATPWGLLWFTGPHKRFKTCSKAT